MLTNADLEKLVETSDEWILQRTGIRERHIVDPGVGDVGPCEGGVARRDPPGRDDAGRTSASSSSARRRRTRFFRAPRACCSTRSARTRAWGFDLGAACSGFTYALTTGMQMVATGAHDHALVVGADVMSSIIDYTGSHDLRAVRRRRRRGRCCRPPDESEPSIIGFAHEIDGSGGPALCMPAGGSRMPASHETVDKRLHYVKQDGQAVFKFAVRKTEEICRRVLDRHGIERRRDRFVRLAPGQPPHHHGGGGAARAAGIDKVVINLERFGNTTAGTIPLALADAVQDGRLKKGDLVLLASVGAGFTVGAVLLRWAL